jgi:hypothetical protein
VDLSRIEENFCVHADAIIKVLNGNPSRWAPDELLALSKTLNIYIYVYICEQDLTDLYNTHTHTQQSKIN